VKLLISLGALLGIALLVGLAAEGIEVDHVRGRSLLSIGTLLLTAWLAGRAVDRIGLPKISGYLLLGLLVGPSVLGLVSKDQLPHLRFVNQLAVSLIALTAGGEIRFDWLRGKVVRIAALVLFDIVVILGAAMALAFTVGPHIPFLQDMPPVVLLAAGLLAGSVMIANSPTVVIAMIADYRAHGPLSQTTLALTVCKDLALIILFAAILTLSRGLVTGDSLSPAFLGAVAVQLVGSCVVGVLAGMGMALYTSKVGAHLPLFLVACCMFLAFVGEVAGSVVHLEPLLMALVAGIVMENAWPERSTPAFHTIEEMSLPVYCLFFALAGAKIDLELFARYWYLSVGYFLLRLCVVWIGISGGAWLIRFREPWARWLFLGMVPQAGVSFVLVTVIATSLSDFPWAVALANVLIGGIILNELLGPLGFRFALGRAGELPPAAGSTPTTATSTKDAPGADRVSS